MRLLLLLVLLLLAAMITLGAQAASVGDPERRALHEAAAAAGSGSSDGAVACPNVTTLAAASTSSARVTSAGAGCKSETLASAKSADDRVALDARSKGIVALQSVPADVQLLCVSLSSLSGVRLGTDGVHPYIVRDDEQDAAEQQHPLGGRSRVPERAANAVRGSSWLVL